MESSSGSITGMVLNNNDIYKDSVLLVLNSNGTISQKMIKSSGQFMFDSLPAGLYSIDVYSDSILVGRESNIVLNEREKKTVNIWDYAINFQSPWETFVNV